MMVVCCLRVASLLGSRVGVLLPLAQLAILLLAIRCLLPLWLFFHFRLDHLFVTRAFFYPQSTLLGPDPQSNLVVVLLNVEKRLHPRPLRAECLFGGNSHRASLEQIHLGGYAHAPCRLGIFRLVCYLPGPPTPRQSLSLRFRESAPINIELTMADSKPRRLVLCPGRMFLFEQWHLLIAAMESNRLLGVDAVIAHVQSISPSVLALLRLYEKEGLLQLRASLRMPAAEEAAFELPFEPNEETLWNNQLVNFQECLYEFKEATAFIGFPDWDDLLIGSGPVPFAEELIRFSGANPFAAAFLPKRFLGRIASLEEITDRGMPGSLELLFPLGIRFSIWPSDMEFISKVFVRPQLVASVELHGAGQMQPGFAQVELPQQIGFFVHARDFKNERIQQTLPTAFQLAENSRQLLARNNFSLGELPRFERFLGPLNRCLRRQNIEGRVRAQKSTKCFNYGQCRPQLGDLHWEGPCVGARNRWDSFSLPSRQLRVFVLRQSRLELEARCRI